jgi:hypothetical protein
VLRSHDRLAIATGRLKASRIGNTFRIKRRPRAVAGCSRLLEKPAVSLTDVRDYLGHRDVGQTNTYLATTTLRLKEAIAKRD